MNPSHNTGTLSEQELIERIVLGEIELFKEITYRYNGYLYKIGRSYNFEHNDVEDLMQDTYVNAYKNLGKFENRSSFKTWIVRIMLNQCYHKKNRASFTNDRALKNEFGESSSTVFYDVDEEVSQITKNNKLIQVLKNAILHIPEDYGMVITLRALNGMSVKETSKALILKTVCPKILALTSEGLASE